MIDVPKYRDAELGLAQVRTGHVGVLEVRAVTPPTRLADVGAAQVRIVQVDSDKP